MDGQQRDDAQAKVHEDERRGQRARRESAEQQRRERQQSRPLGPFGAGAIAPDKREEDRKIEQLDADHRTRFDEPNPGAGPDRDREPGAEQHQAENNHVHRMPSRLDGLAEHRAGHVDQHGPGDEQERHAENGQETGHHLDGGRFDVDRRQQDARQYLAPEAVEGKGMEGSEVIEVVPEELRSVGREQLAADQRARDGQPEAEHERDDEDLSEHRGMGR